MKLLVLLTLLIVASSVANADCPDHSFKCPTGEYFSVGTCWKWSAFSCQTCRSIGREMRDKCRKFSCNGSVDNWYGRNDGCSAKGVSGAMTNVFRAACEIHDICYATPGRTQSQCDMDFRDNMLQTCGFPGVGIVAYPVCASVAGIAYEVVKAHGHTFPEFAATCQEI